MNIEEYRKKWFMHNAMSLLHIPYKWGGDDPTGFDCSGMVIDSLQACGLLLPKTDYTANSLWQKYEFNRISGDALEGDLIFWFTNDKATHVAIALDNHFCLSADGGGSRTATKQDAIKQNAFIKIRPINHRTSPLRIVRLFNDTR